MNAKTRRKEIIDLLAQGPHTAIEISQAVHASVREVMVDLEHVRKSLRGAFIIKPARCLACGFVFRKRTRMNPPARCPLCKKEHIQDPAYACTTS